MGEKITLVAVFYNEEQKLPGYFRNVSCAVDRMVVVDCGSSDRTGQICRRHGATVLSSPYRYFEQNVNRAIEEAGQGWILILDADERLSEDLRKEIRVSVKGSDKDVFYIRRINYLFDGFSTKSAMNTYLPRLFRKGAVKWEREMPHEAPRVVGRAGRLSNLFFHYAYPSVPSFIKKMDEYLCRMPAEYAKRGKKRILIGERDSRVSLLFGAHGLRRMFLYPPALFLNHLFRRGLILDGMRGVIFSASAATYSFFEEAIYWETESKMKRGVRIDWSREYPER